MNKLADQAKAQLNKGPTTNNQLTKPTDQGQGTRGSRTNKPGYQAKAQLTKGPSTKNQLTKPTDQGLMDQAPRTTSPLTRPKPN